MPYEGRQSENSAISLQSANENHRVPPGLVRRPCSLKSLNAGSTEDSNPTLSPSFKIAAKHADSVSWLLFLRFCPVPVTKNREESLASQSWIQGNLMANRTRALYIRITTSDGRKSYCTPVSQSEGRLKPQHAMVKRGPAPQRRRLLPPLRCRTAASSSLSWLANIPTLRWISSPRRSGGSGTGNGGLESSR
jgi:hypothetical protein